MSCFKIEETEQMVKIYFPKALDAVVGQEFADCAQAWMLRPAQYFVFELKETQSIDREFYHAVIHFKTMIKKDSKTILTTHLSQELLKQIRADGVEQVFHPIADIGEFIGGKKTGSAKDNGLNVEFINPFLSATVKTLEVQCKTKVKALAPYLKKAVAPNIAIVGILPLASNGFTGSIVLCFPEAVFLKVYENMFGEKHQTISAEIEDAASELLNIIYGTAKADLNTKGFDFKKSLPTVLTGEKMNIRQSGIKPAVVIPFETELGLFFVEIEFEKTGEVKSV